MRLKHHLCYLALAGIVVAGIAAPAAAQQTIKIGELNSYKAFPAFLEPYKNGMQMAVDEINAKGGVLGKKLEVISRDDGANPGEAVRVADELVAREGVTILAGSLPLQYRPGGRQLCRQEACLLPRRRAADRQDRLAGRQQIYLPPAALDLHADGDAGAGRGRRAQEALGAGLSQLRIRPGRGRDLQGADEEGTAGRPVRHRAGDAARQDRRRRGGAGDRRRQARRHLQRAVRRRSRQVRARGRNPRHLQEPHRGQPA